MSDREDPEGFDREAQKRELREKYAADADDRERTGRMSELLLQGATMTNKHCDRCGSPLFRYEGNEFCPTCQAEGEAAEAAEADATEIEVGASDEEDADAADDEAASADARAADAPDVDASDEGEIAEASTGAPTRSLAPDVDAESPEEHAHEVTAEAHADAGRDASRPDHAHSGGGREQAREPPQSGRAEPDESDATDGVASARASLSRSVSALAERAAAADDPRNARELAAAAREAAEALDALR